MQRPCRGAGFPCKVTAHPPCLQPTFVQSLTGLRPGKGETEMSYQTLLYNVDGAVATITLNRPDRLNTIVPPMPEEIETAVTAAVEDDRVKVIVRRGAGVLRGVRSRRGLSSLGRAPDDGRALGSGQGLRDGDRIVRPGAQVHE